MTVTGYPSPADEYAAHLAAVRVSYKREIAVLRWKLATVEAERAALKESLKEWDDAVGRAHARADKAEAERDRCLTMLEYLGVDPL